MFNFFKRKRKEEKKISIPEKRKAIPEGKFPPVQVAKDSSVILKEDGLFYTINALNTLFDVTPVNADLISYIEPSVKADTKSDFEFGGGGFGGAGAGSDWTDDNPSSTDSSDNDASNYSD